MQEFTTAKDAILSVYPDAEVECNRVDAYPIRVMILREGKEIYSTDQRNLFRKYASKRSLSIQEIKGVLSSSL